MASSPQEESSRPLLKGLDNCKFGERELYMASYKTWVRELKINIRAPLSSPVKSMGGLCGMWGRVRRFSMFVHVDIKFIGWYFFVWTPHPYLSPPTPQKKENLLQVLKYFMFSTRPWHMPIDRHWLLSPAGWLHNVFEGRPNSCIFITGSRP